MFFTEPKSHTRSILKEVLPKYCRGKVVDVGAGRGKYKKLILEYADNYTAIDNESSYDQFGEKKFINKLDYARDALNTPFENESFDTVICTEVLEHIENPFILMKEMSRILKKEGCLILSSGWIALYHPEPKDYFRFSKDGYLHLCEINNLEIKEVIKKGGYFTMLFGLLTRYVDLHGKITRKIYRRTIKFFYLIENFLFWFDKKIKIEDTHGHLIVARKK